MDAQGGAMGVRAARVIRLAVIALSLVHSIGGAAAGIAGSTQAREVPRLHVSLSAAERSLSWDDRLEESERFELPVVILHRQRDAATEADRTLVVTLTGLPAGAAVELALTSLHEDVALGAPNYQSCAYTPARDCTAASPCTVRWALDAASMDSDLYTLQVRDTQSGALLWTRTDGRPDLAALDTWELALGGHTVRIYYATLFPYLRGQDPPDRRLSPAAVTGLIERTFVPMVADTWRIQFEEWGFGPVHADWDADNRVEIYITCPPYALFGGTGIYSRPFAPGGTPFPERRIWWFSSSPAYDGYDTLENGYKVVFAHEFFHLVQWNVALATVASRAGCTMARWNNVLIEGQGKFAPTVQYPEIEMTGRHVSDVDSAYRSAARHYLSHRLNASYAEMERDPVYRYDAALCWRYLYEQSGSMRVIRTALEEMACRYDPDIEAHIGEVMDAALARAGGPFDSFEESMVAFARANYSLRLADGRCTVQDPAACAGRYYDPDELYSAPGLDANLHFSGLHLRYEGTVPAAYGIDLVEIGLDRALNGRTVRIVLQGEGRFSVQAWQLQGGARGSDAPALVPGVATRPSTPHALTAQPALVEVNADGAHIVSFAGLDTARCTRIALIVTRLDVGEGGSYTLTVESE
jgi:hypothetical protein